MDAEDIVTRLRRADAVWESHGEVDDLAWDIAADEIERLRAQEKVFTVKPKVFTVKPDEVLVLIAPDDMPLERAGQWLEHAPQALAGRVFVISGLGARRDR